MAPQNVPCFLSHLYKRRSTKSCTWVHDHWPCVKHWDDLYLLDIPQNFCTWACIETSQAETSWFWRPTYNPIYWVLRKCCECRCDTCFMGNFGRRNRWKHSFLYLTHLEVKVSSRPSKWGQIAKHKIFILNHAHIVQFCLRILKMTFILMYNN